MSGDQKPLESPPSTSDNPFEITRVNKDIGLDRFCREFVEKETPVIMEGVGCHWPARTKWSSDYLQMSLSQEPSVEEHTVYYQMPANTLDRDYEMPGVVSHLIGCRHNFPMPKNTRIWINTEHNVSHWHYDSKLENIFNVQVKGRKHWCLISPRTPPACYPFSNFALLEDDRKVLKNKRYSRFVLEEGDMLYLPPLWFHKVVALDKESINLNWVFTKRRTEVSSKALRRELERYLLDLYFRNHKLPVLRFLYEKLGRMFPTYLGLAWPYRELTDSPVTRRRFHLTRRVLSELGMLVRALATVSRLRVELRTLDRVPRLTKAARD